jgi:adenylyltransferase/sulfurtransferase
MAEIPIPTPLPRLTGEPDAASAAGGSMAPAPAGEAAGLTGDEILRYGRHLILPEVGIEGQRKLKAASVLLVGAGGLGAPLGLYLAAAGIGRIGIVDFDVVEVTNLHRQVIHSTNDVGRQKIDSAAEKMLAINPELRVTKHATALSSGNALEILEEYGVVVDGTDNFPTRYLVNDACVLSGKPDVYGSVFRFEGQATIFAYPGGPCYRCLYPEPPPPRLAPNCAEGGVLGVLPGTIGLIQATETVKLILGIGEPLVGRLLLYDALSMRFRELKLRRNPECPACGGHRTITRLLDYDRFCGVPAQETKVSDGEIGATELKAKLDRGDDFVLIDVREPHEYGICSIPGSKPIPLGELPKRLEELDPAAEVVVYCRSGTRSALGCGVLRRAGFARVRNLVGGILAWSDQVDPSVPKY